MSSYNPPQGPVQRIEHGNGHVSYVWPAEYIGDIKNVLERSRKDLTFVPAGPADDWGYPVQLVQEKESDT